MARIPPRFIDCNAHPDLLADWPVGPLVRASQTAQCLLHDLEQGWTLRGADLDGRDYDIDPHAMTITVNTGGLTYAAIQRSHYFQNILTLRSFAALRAAWQAEREDDALDMHRLDLWPLLARIFKADIDIMTLRMAHELRDEGYDALWRHVLGDDGGDMAAVYARTRSCMTDTHGDDTQAMTLAFGQWFEKQNRVTRCDFETLSEMDALLPQLTMEGTGQLRAGAIRCLTIDPMNGVSYLGHMADEMAGNPAWRGITDPIAEAHFSQIIDEIGATRIGSVAMRDRKLAARLFPGMLADPVDLCVK